MKQKDSTVYGQNSEGDFSGLPAASVGCHHSGVVLAPHSAGQVSCIFVICESRVPLQHKNKETQVTSWYLQQRTNNSNFRGKNRSTGNSSIWIAGREKVKKGVFLFVCFLF